MRPVCAGCHIEMTCVKNSVTVAMTEQDPHFVRSGDKYECDECGQQIITGFSKGFRTKDQPDVILEDDDEFEV